MRGLPTARTTYPTAAQGQEGQFAPPRLSDRSAFSEETFAERCGNEKDARRKMVYRGGCGSAWIDERAFPFCDDDWIEVGATSRIGEGAIRWRISWVLMYR
jgi:hypothetical protein